ncbi:hypothetical protein ACF0H5_003376 [Mactra antiquata]
MCITIFLKNINETNENNKIENNNWHDDSVSVDDADDDDDEVVVVDIDDDDDDDNGDDENHPCELPFGSILKAEGRPEEICKNVYVNNVNVIIEGRSCQDYFTVTTTTMTTTTLSPPIDSGKNNKLSQNTKNYVWSSAGGIVLIIFSILMTVPIVFQCKNVTYYFFYSKKEKDFSFYSVISSKSQEQIKDVYF